MPLKPVRNPTRARTCARLLASDGHGRRAGALPAAARHRRRGYRLDRQFRAAATMPVRQSSRRCARYRAKPDDPRRHAMRGACAPPINGTGGAVLEQASIRKSNNMTLLGDYGPCAGPRPAISSGVMCLAARIRRTIRLARLNAKARCRPIGPSRRGAAIIRRRSDRAGRARCVQLALSYC